MGELIYYGTIASELVGEVDPRPASRTVGSGGVRSTRHYHNPAARPPDERAHTNHVEVQQYPVALVSDSPNCCRFRA